MRFGIRLARQLYRQHRQLFVFPLTGLVLFLMLLWIVVAIRLSDDKAEALASAQTSAQVLAASLAQHTVSVVHDVDLLGRLIKYEYERDPATFRLANLLSSGLVTADNAVQITLIGSDGHIVDSSTPFSGEIDLTDRTHFSIHQTNPEVGLFISPPVFGRISHQWTIQMTRRLNGPHAHFNGVVVVSESPRIFTDGFFNTAALGPRGMVAVVSEHGTILSRRTANDSLASAGPYNAAALSRTDADYGVVPDPIDGVRRVVASAPVDGYGLVAVVGLSEADALDELAEGTILYLSIGVAGSLFLICFFFSAIFVLTRVASESNENRIRAEVDPLTGLPNRYKVTIDLGATLACDDTLARPCLFLIDLNGFKYINDMHGRDMGDFVLEETALHIRDAVADKGRVYRVGGDEFAVLSVAGQSEAVALAETLTRTLNARRTLMGEDYRLPASIGIALPERSGETATTLLSKADLALQAAKAAGRGHEATIYRFYEEAMHQKLIHATDVVNAVNEAMQRDEFRFTYAPIRHAATQRVVALRTLIRWQHPTLGDVDVYDHLREANSPPLAERVDVHLLSGALSELRSAPDLTPPPLYYSFIHSPGVLSQPNFAAIIARLVESYQIRTATLYLEFDASSDLLAGQQVKNNVDKLKTLGVRIVISAFDAGIVPWAEGQQAFPDGIHLKDSLWRPSVGDLGIVQGIVHIARSLDIAVFATAVTSEEQIAVLRPHDKAFFSGPAAGEPLAHQDAASLVILSSAD